MMAGQQCQNVVFDTPVSGLESVDLSAFDRSTFTAERWSAMAAGPAFAEARDLVAYDAEGAAVAGITVWSAGPGRPGVIEPMRCASPMMRAGSIVTAANACSSESPSRAASAADSIR